MIDSGLTYDQVAARAKVSQTTIWKIKNDPKLDPKRIQALKEQLAAKLYNVVDLSISSLTPAKLEKANAQQNMMVAAIGIDKARLIEGQATSRVEFVNSSDKELAGQIEKLNEELAKLERGEFVDAEVSTNQPESQASPSDSPPPVEPAITPPAPALELDTNRVSPENNEV